MQIRNHQAIRLQIVNEVGSLLTKENSGAVRRPRCLSSAGALIELRRSLSFTLTMKITFGKANELGFPEVRCGCHLVTNSLTNEALAVIKELETKYSRKEATGMALAKVYVGLGEKNKVFEWLEKDFQARNGFLQFVRWESIFEPIRNDPRYTDLLKRMNLPV